MDVARMAGVSQASVSRAFANVGGVSDATRERIFGIAREIGYWPNALASSLITRSSGLIGVVVSDLTNPFLSDVLDRILIRLKAAQLQPLIFSPRSEADHTAAAFDLGRYAVDGLFVISPHLERATAQQFSRLGPTVLLFNPNVPGLKSSSIVSVDNYEAGRTMAAHLLGLGHARFGYVHGIEDSGNDRERYLGFADRLKASGCRIAFEATGGYQYGGAAEAVMPMLQSRRRPTAIFCANDLMAMGVADAARHRIGLRIPDDLSVAGFDDIAPAAWSSYELTTMRQPVDAILHTGVSILLEHLAGTRSRPRTATHAADLIVRSSTGPTGVARRG